MAIGTRVELSRVPYGPRRVVVVDVRDGPSRDAQLLRYGISAPFDFAHGEKHIVEVLVALRPVPRLVDAELLVGTSTTRVLLRSPLVDLLIRVDHAVEAIVANRPYESFAMSVGTQVVEVATPGVCENVAASPGCWVRVPWDLDAGLDAPCVDQNQCERRVSAQLRDAYGLLSDVASGDVVVDTRPPSLDGFGASVDVTITPPSHVLLGSTSAATHGSTIVLRFQADEPLRPPPERFTAEGPDGSSLEFERIAVEVYGAIYRAVVPAPDTVALSSGVYHPRLTIIDLAGNERDVDSFVERVELRVDPPELRVDQANVTFVRSTAYRHDDEVRGDLTIPGGPAHASLAPADPLATTTTLPEETFVLSDGSSPSAIRIYGDARRSLAFSGLILPNADGSWNRDDLRLGGPVVPTVYVAGLDTAGNESDPVAIENAWYVASSAPGVGGSSASEVGRAPEHTQVLEVGELLGNPVSAAARDNVGVESHGGYRWRKIEAPRATTNVVPFASIYDAGRDRVFARGWTFDGETRSERPELDWLGLMVHDPIRGENLTFVPGMTVPFDADGVSLALGHEDPEDFLPYVIAFDPHRQAPIAMTRTTEGWQTWTRIDTTWTPTADHIGSDEANHRPLALVFVPNGALMVAVGANGLKTYHLDGDDWVSDGLISADVALPNNTFGFRYTSLVYEPREDRVVLFLSNDGPDTQIALHRTEGAWSALPEGPPPRPIYSAIYDSKRDRIVANAGEFFLQNGAWQQIDEFPVEAYEFNVLHEPVHLLRTPSQQIGLLTQKGSEGRLRLRTGLDWSREAEPWAYLPYTSATAFDAARNESLLLWDGACFGGTTLVWDGATFTNRGATSVTPYDTLSVTYDSVRNAVLAADACGEIWSFNGSKWTHQPTLRLPNRPITGEQLVFDPVRQRLAHGPTRGVVEWDGTAWRQLPPPPDNGPYNGYVSLQRATDGGWAAVTYNGGVAVWSGDAWTLSSSNLVNATLRSNVAFDPTSNALVALFYHSGRTEFMSWRAGVWSPYGPSSAPASSFPEARLIYSTTRGAMVFADRSQLWELGTTGWVSVSSGQTPPTFLGLYADGPATGLLTFGPAKVWRLTGSTFRDVSVTPVRPLPRTHSFTMAFDYARGVVVAVGSPTSVDLEVQTWEWDGARWRLAASDRGAPRTSRGHMAFDGRQVRIVEGSRTWTWDGARWTEREGLPSMAGFHNHRLVYDELREQLILLQGARLPPETALQVWALRGSTWTNLEVPPPALTSTSDIDVNRLAFLAGFDPNRGSILLMDPFDLTANGNGWELVPTRGPNVQLTVPLPADVPRSAITSLHVRAWCAATDRDTSGVEHHGAELIAWSTTEVTPAWVRMDANERGALDETDLTLLEFVATSTDSRGSPELHHFGDLVRVQCRPTYDGIGGLDARTEADLMEVRVRYDTRAATSDSRR